MNSIEVLTLMTGVINVKHFTKFYLKGDSYHVRVDHHYYPSNCNLDFHEFIVYINNVLVFQQCPDNLTLENNISTVKELLINRDDDNDDEIKNPPYAYRIWSVINGIPVIINGVFEDGVLITSVYYNQIVLSVDGEAERDEFGSYLLLVINTDYKTEELSKEDSKYIVKTLWAIYSFDHKKKQFIHRDDDDENDDCEDDQEIYVFDGNTKTIFKNEILYYLVDNKLYDVVTNEYVRNNNTPLKYDKNHCVITEIEDLILRTLRSNDAEPDTKPDVKHESNTTDNDSDYDSDNDSEMIATVEIIINEKCYLKCSQGDIYDRETHQFIGFYLEESNSILLP
jgi:hypothetical protein